MTPDRPEPAERRASLSELEPDLQKRVLSLDEPIGWGDWQDVVRRSHASAPFRNPKTLAAIVLTVACVGAAGVAVGSQLSGQTDHGPLTAAVRTVGQAVDVSPGPQGGLCYRWPDGSSGCARLETTALDVSWQNNRVMGAVSSGQISSIKITFADGTSVRPRISWLATPVNAGFFLYDIPPGKIVVSIDGLRAGRVSREVTWFTT
jgi:hypothetical protein